MEDDFFVMVNTPDGGYTPLMDETGEEVAKYLTLNAAIEDAKHSVWGEMFGFEVFERGLGIGG